MIFSILAAIVSVAGGFVPYLGIYQIILQFLEGTPTLPAVLVWGGICVAGYLVKYVFYVLSTSLSHISAYHILENIRLALTDKLMKAPLGVVLGQPAGKLKNVIIDRVESIELPLAHMIPEGISNLLLPLVVLGYLFSLNWVMALATLACVPIGAVVYSFMMRNYNTQYEEYMQANHRVNSIIVEYVEGIEVIKAFGQSATSYEKFSGAVREFKDFTLDWFRSTWKLMQLGGAILPTTLLGALPVGILLVSGGNLSIPGFVMCVILGMSITAPMTWFTTAVNEFKMIEYGIRDTNEILCMPELPDSSQPVKLTSHDISFEHVRFAYSEEAGDVLHDINLTMPTGSFTALIGPSGGGKSTVARLLARFWDVSGGSIKVGGNDIREIPLSQLEEHITFVTQDNYLFGTSLLENIRVGKPDATDDEVLAAAKAAQCEEFISRLENGWDTTAGEAGKQLSGGERQRIAIARAILKNAPIVILDEATAFTDPENEARLQESISTLTRGKTLLVIAHRLSTITKADQIVVLEDGVVRDTGKHESLLQHCPLYNDMWRAHTGALTWNVSQDTGNMEKEAKLIV
ncbi:MAG: ABC transporter ATP-binding protein [Oscillospiraceae bacterium]